MNLHKRIRIIVAGWASSFIFAGPSTVVPLPFSTSRDAFRCPLELEPSWLMSLHDAVQNAEEFLSYDLILHGLRFEAVGVSASVAPLLPSHRFVISSAAYVAFVFDHVIS